MGTGIEGLKAELAELRRKVEYTDNYASGIQLVLMAVLPVLLKQHPHAGLVLQTMQGNRDRHAELLAHPDRVEDGEHLDMYEAGNMMLAQLALLGVRPEVGSEAFAGRWPAPVPTSTESCH